MLRQTRLIPIALFLTGALNGPVAAQGQRTTVDAADLFNGQGPAGTITLKSLDQTWRRVTINGPEELKGGGIGQLAGGIFGAMFGGAAAPASSNTPPTYTRGATANFGSETFLVVYRPNLKSLDVTTLMQAGPAGKLPAPERLTQDTPLTLMLVNVRSITSMGDFRPFNLQQELADSAKAADEEAKLIEQLQQNGGAVPAGPGGLGAFEPNIPAAPVISPHKPAPAKKPAPKKK